MKINQKKMRKVEKEYTTMKSKEKEDEIEIRVNIWLFDGLYSSINIGFRDYRMRIDCCGKG